MKIRYGLVSNSSSTTFLITCKKGIPFVDDIGTDETFTLPEMFDCFSYMHDNEYMSSNHNEIIRILEEGYSPTKKVLKELSKMVEESYDFYFFQLSYTNKVGRYLVRKFVKKSGVNLILEINE